MVCNFIAHAGICFTPPSVVIIGVATSLDKVADGYICELTVCGHMCQSDHPSWKDCRRDLHEDLRSRVVVDRHN